MSTTTAAEPVAGTRTYQLDPAHSSVDFSVRHLMIAHVRGRLCGLSGVLVLDPANPAQSSVEVSIDLDSISTGEPQRDGHLKSADFFDTATYPTATFKSTSVAVDGGSGEVTGDLTVRGITKPVVLKVEESSDEIKDPMGTLRIAFSATTKIKRSEFGLTFNMPLEAGGVAIGDDVKITLDAQFTRPAA